MDDAVPPRVFLSYAHESDEHAETVRELWMFLCENGVDARWDQVAAQERQDWTRLTAAGSAP